MSKRSYLSQWAAKGDKLVGVPSTAPYLPPGCYRAGENYEGPYLEPMNLVSDVLSDLNSSATTRVLEILDKFWGAESRFREFGFLWKRGILMSGPQGCGKTGVIMQAVRSHINAGGVALFVDDPDPTGVMLKQIREIEPDRSIICILEDLDSLIEDNGESDMLALLDGETQIDKIVFLATTNHVEKLPARIRNRPSRFDTHIVVGLPNVELRSEFLRNIGGAYMDDVILQNLVELTEGFSLAHLKELVISIFLFENSVEDAVSILREMMKGGEDNDD